VVDNPVADHTPPSFEVSLVDGHTFLAERTPFPATPEKSIYPLYESMTTFKTVKESKADTVISFPKNNIQYYQFILFSNLNSIKYC